MLGRIGKETESRHLGGYIPRDNSKEPGLLVDEVKGIVILEAVLHSTRQA